MDEWPCLAEPLAQPDHDATIPLMDELEIGVRVVVTDARTLGAVGIAHAPGPVRPDDLIAFGEGHPWRVLTLLPTASSATLRVLADQVALAITAR